MLTRLRSGWTIKNNNNFSREKKSKKGHVTNSVPDPHVFGPPGSGSTSLRYGSGSGSGFFYHHAKIVRKTLISSILWLFLTFYLWKMMQMYFQKIISRKNCVKICFCWHLEGQWQKYQDPDPDPLIRGMDPEHCLQIHRKNSLKFYIWIWSTFRMRIRIQQLKLMRIRFETLLLDYLMYAGLCHRYLFIDWFVKQPCLFRWGAQRPPMTAMARTRMTRMRRMMLRLKGGRMWWTGPTSCLRTAWPPSSS